VAEQTPFQWQYITVFVVFSRELSILILDKNQRKVIRRKSSGILEPSSLPDSENQNGLF
jgi:hypothetical protein